MEVINKRIAMFSYHTCPLASYEGKETGGMNVYVLELSKKLVKKGFTIDIFTRSQDRRQPKIVNVEKNLRVIHLKAGKEKNIAKKNLINFIPEFVESFNKFMEKEGIEYDFFHCHYYLSGLAAYHIKKHSHKNTPFIITFHTLALMKNLVARGELEREENERVEAEKFLTIHADKIIAPSESDSLYLQYLYECKEEKIYVIPPGVDKNIFKPMSKKLSKSKINSNQNDRFILFVGRIEPLKGIDVLMYATKILIEKNSSFNNLCLLIVGGDISKKTKLSNELKKLQELRHTLNLSTNVKFIGQVRQEMLPYYYNASELVVIPSHYESFGMAALEAMSCGIPVITTNVAGISELLDEKHQALITTSNNPLLLASQIEDLLTDEKVHEKLGREVFLKVQDLSWNNISDRIIKVYNTFT